MGSTGQPQYRNVTFWANAREFFTRAQLGPSAGHARRDGEEAGANAGHAVQLYLYTRGP